MTNLLQQALVNVHDAILRGNTDGELLSMIDDALRDAKAQQEQPAQEPVAWDGAEGWEPLAWHLCAEENGEEACNELIWEGGATPEPWGDRWLKYEHAAKQMIATVKKFAAPTQPALKDDIGVACLETMVKTMTNLGIATDASIEGFGARLESNIYAMCRTVDGIFKAQQEQPAQEASATWTEMVVVNLVREGVNKHRARELAAHFLTLPTQPALSDEEILAMNAGEVFFSESPSKYPEAGHGTQYHAGAPGVLKFARAIEAHCRGGANG